MSSSIVEILFKADGSAAIREMNRVISAEELMASTMKTLLGPAIAGLGIYELTGQMIDAAIASQRMTNGLTAATGSAVLAADDLAFVRAEARALGLELQLAGNDFTRLEASARGTSLEGEKVDEIFTAVAGSATVLGLRADETSGAIQAITQMISKGTVQAEELRGQLGERLPGAFQIAARAMGVTTSELGKMLEQGEVISEDFLPKFAAELKKTFPVTEEAAHSVAAEINRLKTSFFDLKVTVMDLGGSGAMEGSLVGLTTMIETINADLLIGVRLLAEEKLMLQQLFDEVAIRMDSGENLNRWLQPEGRAELRAELEASRQMYEYSWQEIQKRYGNFKEEVSPFVGPPEPPAKNQSAIDKAARERAKAQAKAEKEAQEEYNRLLRENPVQRSWYDIDQAGMNDANALIDQTALDKKLELSAILREMELADISARVQMYADGEAARISALEKSTQYEKSLRQDVLLNSVALFKALGVNQKAAAIAGIAINKGIALSAAYTSTASGAQLAFASQLIPGDPTSLARAAAASAFTWKMGALNMALITASGFAEGFNAAGGSNPAGGGFSGGMGSSAVTPAPVLAEKEEVRPSKIFNLSFYGYVDANDPDSLARKISAALRTAEEDGY